ncbi:MULTISPECIES: hypothetical protein [unclassified Streptomyces]|uniref:hypothetical protein n=1 Tax=unclassified Streptomyces TaxID=2593676 RepID=UPI00332E8558
MDETRQARWALGYEAEGSDDAAWTLRHGTGHDTTVYEATAQIAPDDLDTAKRWGAEGLNKHEDADLGVVWEPHHPGPGTAPDYFVAVITSTSA